MYKEWVQQLTDERICVNCGQELINTPARMNKNGEPVHLNCGTGTLNIDRLTDRQ
jgi:hypothetical protein